MICALLRTVAIPALSVLAAVPSEPIEIGYEPQLFVDDYLVANRWAIRTKHDAVVHRLHAPVKHPANPLIPDSTGYVNVAYDTETDLYRMWYQVWYPNWRENPDHPKYAVAYAESEDGVTWKRPTLGICEWDGSTDNNICWGGRGNGNASGASLVVVPPEHRHGYKYLLLYSAGSGLNLVGSRDGIRWDENGKTLIKHLHSDTNNNVVYDPFQERFILYCRPRHAFRGWIDPREEGGMRRVACMTSKELWTEWKDNPHAILIPDRLDMEQGFNFFYGMRGVYYGGVFFGFLWPFKLNTDIYTELVYGRDGITFDRFPGRPRLIDLGPADAWDDGMTFGSPWVEVGNEWRIYYCGHDGAHGAKERQAGIGLATIRKEGFISLHGPARDGGMVCTRILRWPGGELVVNADTATEGRLCVRVLTPLREVIPGYDYAACGDLSGDSTDHVLRWGDRSMATLTGRELRIEFYLEDTDLYSFRVLTPGQSIATPQLTRTENRSIPGARSLERQQKTLEAVTKDTAKYVRNAEEREKDPAYAAPGPDEVQKFEG